MKIAVFYENIHETVQVTGADMEEALAALRGAGMELLYLTPDSWRRDRQALSGPLERLGLKIEGMHGFCDFAKEPDTLLYREMIDLAAEAGAGNFLIVPGMYSTGNTKRDLENMVRGVRRAVEYGRRKSIPVLMEDYDGIFAPYNCIAGLQYFMEAAEGLGCAFDTGNFALFRENELEAFRLFADRIRTVHLKDRCAAPRHEGDHPFLCADGAPAYACRIGSGDMKIAEILAGLKERAYPGNVIVELYAVDPKYILEDALASVAWVRSQLQEG